MKKKVLPFGTIVTLLVAVSPDAGSDSAVSNRFALGEAEPISRSAGSGSRRSAFQVTVRLVHGGFVFYTGRTEKHIVGSIYSIDGRKVAEPVLIQPGIWRWGSSAQNADYCGAGCYLAVFECGNDRSTVPVIRQAGNGLTHE
ncbi:MAG: hypothetical protein JW913_02840 [Chitinispirillaceae bacterium]|nr:hypothetical protein [Chitinispirillaceae bacterium]